MAPVDAFLSLHGAFTWDDLVAAQDFGFLTPLEIQAQLAGGGPAAQRLKALSGEELRTFETCLWEACAEAVGKAPRPGSARWARAQDRWREAILRSVLAAETTSAELARRVEHLYEQVGCPEDMLTMLRPSRAWSGTPATVDPEAVRRFLDHRERLKAS